jgi:hypothetical protein
MLQLATVTDQELLFLSAIHGSKMEHLWSQAGAINSNRWQVVVRRKL